jgi:subtilisin family serine protease
MHLSTSFVRGLSRSLAIPALFSFAAAVLFPAALAQAPAKKVVKTEADLPRFNYPLTTTATELLQSDDATFNAFAAKVRADVDSVLNDYDVQDHAAQRALVGVRLQLAVLAGDDEAALKAIEQLRALQDKPDARLTTGLQLTSIIQAAKETGKSSGPEFAAAFEKDYAAALKPLPWDVVGNRIKEAKSSAEIVTPSLILGSIQANIEPAVAKSHSLSNDLAWGLVGARVSIKRVLPLKQATVAVLTADVAAHNVQKPDIWAEREVTLTSADKLTAVNVAIWDSGSDLSLFGDRVLTDPHPTPLTDPHDIAFDLKGFPDHGYLMPLSGDQLKQYPGMREELKGFSDLELSIDSPEASSLKQKLGSLAPGDVPAFIEQLEMFAQYSHGTHVAGIASHGNPAIRLAVGRITFDYHNVPLAPSEELSRRAAEDSQKYVDWFKANHIRVVNMSWGGSPQDDESALEKNGLGKDAADRKAIAAKLFAIEREGLFNAIKNAPEILFICAAGNSDSDSTFIEDMPSSFKLPNLLAVGAVDQSGDEASFTSYGPTVLVDANGYQVESVVPGGAKVRMSGTSMASPNAVNLAAKLIALDPKLTPEQTVHLMVEGSTPSADGRRHNLNPKRSVELLQQLPASGK